MAFHSGDPFTGIACNHWMYRNITIWFPTERTLKFESRSYLCFLPYYLSTSRLALASQRKNTFENNLVNSSPFEPGLRLDDLLLFRRLVLQPVINTAYSIGHEIFSLPQLRSRSCRRQQRLMMPPAETQKNSLKKCNNTAPWIFSAVLQRLTPPAETPKKNMFEEMQQHSTLGLDGIDGASSRQTKINCL